MARRPTGGVVVCVVDVGGASRDPAPGRTTCAVAGRDPSCEFGAGRTLRRVLLHRRDRTRGREGLDARDAAQGSSGWPASMLDLRPASGAQQSAAVVAQGVSPSRARGIARRGRQSGDCAGNDVARRVGVDRTESSEHSGIVRGAGRGCPRRRQLDHAGSVHRRGADAHALQQVQERIGTQLIHCATVAVVLTTTRECVDALERRRGTRGRKPYAEKTRRALAIGLAGNVAVGSRFGGARGGIWIGLQDRAAEAIPKLARCELAGDRQHSAGDRRCHRVVDQRQDVCEDPCTANVDRAPTKCREDLRDDPSQVAAELDLRTSGRLRPRQREGDLVSVETGPCVGSDRDNRLEQAGGCDRNLTGASAQHGNRIVT